MCSCDITLVNIENTLYEAKFRSENLLENANKNP